MIPRFFICETLRGQSYLYTNTFTIFAENQGPGTGLCCEDLLIQEAQPQSKLLTANGSTKGVFGLPLLKNCAKKSFGCGSIGLMWS